MTVKRAAEMVRDAHIAARAALERGDPDGPALKLAAMRRSEMLKPTLARSISQRREMSQRRHPSSGIDDNNCPGA